MVQAVAEDFTQTEGQAIMAQVEQALFRGAQGVQLVLIRNVLAGLAEVVVPMEIPLEEEVAAVIPVVVPVVTPHRVTVEVEGPMPSTKQ